MATARKLAMSTHLTGPEALLSEEKIAERAYQKWISRGCPISDGTEDWFAARAELARESAELENVTQLIDGDFVSEAAPQPFLNHSPEHQPVELS